MALANQEAQRFNHEYIGTEHILLGLVKEGSGVGANVLKNLDAELKSVVFAQDEAVDQLASAIKLSRAGLRSPEKPIGSFLFTGPTGVGKTELAKQLARIMGIAFIRFDMSEYQEAHSVSRLVGAPPGYVGFDRGGLLTEALNKTPHAVLLLDEVEKAHQDVFNMLLQIMDHGTLTDNNGRPTDFRHAVLIMTSNVGARGLATARVGFGDRGINTGDEERAFKNMFSPEFRNRLDARIRFSSLDPAVMGRIVDTFVRELSAQLADRDVTISVSDEARSYLAEEGFDKLMGARPLARVIEQQLKRPLSEAILFGELQNGGKVSVGLRGPAPKDKAATEDKAANGEAADDQKPELSFVYTAAEASKEATKLLGDGGKADRKQLSSSDSDPSGDDERQPGAEDEPSTGPEPAGDKDAED